MIAPDFVSKKEQIMRLYRLHWLISGYCGDDTPGLAELKQLADEQVQSLREAYLGAHISSKKHDKEFYGAQLKDIETQRVALAAQDIPLQELTFEAHDVYGEKMKWRDIRAYPIGKLRGMEECDITRGWKAFVEAFGQGMGSLLSSLARPTKKEERDAK